MYIVYSIYIVVKDADCIRYSDWVGGNVVLFLLFVFRWAALGCSARPRQPVVRVR